MTDGRSAGMLKRWTDEEIEFLKANRKLGLSELAKRLGRTEAAVRKKKYDTKPIWEIEKAMPEPLTQYEKEARIIKMAADMRVKLKGWNEA